MAEKRTRSAGDPDFTCNVYKDGASFGIVMDFDASFEQDGATVVFDSLLDPDLEQLELDLTRHLETVKRMQAFSKKAPRPLPGKLE